MLSVPGTIRREIEITMINSLRAAAEFLSHQAAPPNTGCALQSIFLVNVLALIENPSQCHMARNTPQKAPRLLPGQQLEEYERTMQATEMLRPSLHEAQQQISHRSSGHDAILGKSNDSSLSLDFQDFDFDDNQMWSRMFASAGFAIDDGTFLPDVGGN